jgi:hypothetical protein
MFKQLLINDLPFSVKDKRKKQAVSNTICAHPKINPGRMNGNDRRAGSAMCFFKQGQVCRNRISLALPWLAFQYE